jgi:hypothetical protein
MFDINQNFKIDTDIPIISDNYQLIHFDEFPILYTGTNEYGARVVGSLCAENEDGDSFRYLHSIVSNINYVKFIKNKISYRQLLETIERIFVLDKSINDDLLVIYNVPLQQIPEDYLPLPNIFCPYSEIIFGTEFTISLKGKLADAHEALVNQVAIISENTAQFLTTITSCIKIGNLTPEIHQIASTPTSFGINFKIKFNSNDLFYDKKGEKALNEYMNKVVDYSLNYMPAEIPKLKDNDIANTHYVQMVLEPLENAYQILFQQFDEKTKQRLLANILKIPFELEKMTDELGNGFDYLEIKTHNTDDDKPKSLGVLDKVFSEELSVATDLLENSENIIIDDSFANYEIHVYHLNIVSRKGNAHIKNVNEDGEDILDSPKFVIQGDKGLDGSDFIKSMDKGSWIPIRAKAKKVNGRYKILTIEFD